jgi:hypothetical protein
MRALICGMFALLIPALGSAEMIQFTFNGTIASDPPYFQSTWNGSGPQPQTLELSFDVNTLAPGSSLSYGFYNSSIGPSLDSITASMATTNVTLQLDGKTVLHSPTGTFAFSGELLGPFSFIGGDFRIGLPGATFSMVPDFGLSVTTQSAITGSSDPLGTLLNPSGFSSDDGGGPYSFLLYDNSQLYTTLSGGGTAVPEPDALALLALAFIVLVLVHARRHVGAGSDHLPV